MSRRVKMGKPGKNSSIKRWICINTVFLGAALLWLAGGYEWTGVVFRAIIYASVIAVVLLIIARVAQPPAVHWVVDGIYDLVIIAILSAYGENLLALLEVALLVASQILDYRGRIPSKLKINDQTEGS